MRRWLILLFAATSIFAGAAPAFAGDQGDWQGDWQSDWQSGCTGGFGCWSDIGDGDLTKVDQSESFTCNDWLADWYARNGDQSFGWHKDYFLNRMTASHTHGFGDSWHMGKLFCSNPTGTTPTIVDGTTKTGVWDGYSGLLSRCAV